MELYIRSCFWKIFKKFPPAVKKESKKTWAGRLIFRRPFLFALGGLDSESNLPRIGIRPPIRRARKIMRHPTPSAIGIEMSHAIHLPRGIPGKVVLVSQLGK
jgi:hypothetical protein